jgi:hypothetical protein
MIPLKDKEAEAYAIHIQELITQLKKKSKKAIAENEQYIIDGAMYNGRIGETFYLFPDDAPSQEIIDRYEKCKPYFGKGEFAVSFEEHLSHKQMTVIFSGNDLVIRKDRGLIIDRLTENNLRNNIEYAKENYVIDWDNAQIFIFPYKTNYFYISDSFEVVLGGGRADLKDSNNWFSIPFTEKFDYKVIRQMCLDYANTHPLDEKYINESFFTLG